MGLTRRNLLAVAGCLAASPLGTAGAVDADQTDELIELLFGKKATESGRVHLLLPGTFPTGYTVPLSLQVDSPMTPADHVRNVRVLAPKNPITEVVRFNFTPRHSVARVSTRIRLAEPQAVVAVAEMNDGALLMARTWVAVATNGCAE